MPITIKLRNNSYSYFFLVGKIRKRVVVECSQSPFLFGLTIAPTVLMGFLDLKKFRFWLLSHYLSHIVMSHEAETVRTSS